MSPKNNLGAAAAATQLDPKNIEILSKIQKATQDANELMRQKYLKDIWSFEDLHSDDDAPAYVHRIKNYEVKHIQTIGENMLLINNQQENIDVYSTD